MDLKRAMQLLDMLREDGLEPNVITYGTLMTACERCESMAGVSRVFRFMREDGIEPNEIVYGAALSACRKAGEAERAFLLLRKMMRDGLEPNVATFNTVLMAQTEAKNRSAKNIERAVLVYKSLASSDYTAGSPNRQTYTILIRALAGNMQPRDAETMIRRMREDGLVPDVDLYTATVAAYERAGKYGRALRLMESMREDGYNFYEMPLLDKAFKRAVRLANAVGRTWSDEPEEDDEQDPVLFPIGA
jgi:pentatricopeptide repeat domain-containing protein 1